MRIVYIRTSTKEQTPELQLRDILPMITGEHKVFSEKISAYKENVKRPVFDEVLKLIESGKVTHLYAWDLDRLYRNRLKLKALFQTCKDNGTIIRTFNQKWLDDINNIPIPFNDIVFEMLINVMGWIGEDESKKKSGRIKNAVVRKEGDFTKSYKGNKWGRKPIPEWVIRAVYLLNINGKSLREISKIKLVSPDLKTSMLISKSAVHKILTTLPYTNTEK
jgi:DNA invertase Pin-like site-specific DNA recombinase